MIHLHKIALVDLIALARRLVRLPGEDAAYAAAQVASYASGRIEMPPPGSWRYAAIWAEREALRATAGRLSQRARRLQQLRRNAARAAGTLRECLRIDHELEPLCALLLARA